MRRSARLASCSVLKSASHTRCEERSVPTSYLLCVNCVAALGSLHGFDFLKGLQEEG